MQFFQNSPSLLYSFGARYRRSLTMLLTWKNEAYYYIMHVDQISYDPHLLFIKVLNLTIDYHQLLWTLSRRKREWFDVFRILTVLLFELKYECFVFGPLSPLSHCLSHWFFQSGDPPEFYSTGDVEIQMIFNANISVSEEIKVKHECS